MNEPLTPSEARRLILQILKTGTVEFSRHALDSMRRRGMTHPEVLNTLRAGRVEAPELERDSWRYRVRTARAYVVVAFYDETVTIIVTAWKQ